MQLFSSYSDGTEEHTCKVDKMMGTSMACPVVAGAAAMVRKSVSGCVTVHNGK